jgi:hypothetical protein
VHGYPRSIFPLSRSSFAGSEALDEVNQLMGQVKRDGAGAIEDLYFTNFAVQ